MLELLIAASLITGEWPWLLNTYHLSDDVGTSFQSQAMTLQYGKPSPR